MIKMLMLKQTLKNTKKSNNTRKKHVMRGLLIGGIVVFFGVASFGPTIFTSAQSLQEQINQLNRENAQTAAEKKDLAIQAVSFEDTINKLAQQIDSLQLQINDNNAKINELNQKIADKEAELARQKVLLGDNIRKMYVEGDISTVEMLASSKNLSDFIDKQQYRNAVKNKIVDTLAKINELKFQLKTESEQVQQRLAEQKQSQSQFDAQRSEQNRLLGMNESQRAELDSKIKGNNQKIQELQRQQVLENIRLFGGGGGTVGGGGYPWGSAVCIHTGQVTGACSNYDWAVNGNIWNWQTGGYGYRNCTDWVAFKVIASTGYIPSGLGNAKDWPGRAAARGFTVSSTPRVGAAAVSTAGYYGHVMYVEGVNGDGTIVISDYNRAGTGLYSTATINASGLQFVYF